MIEPRIRRLRSGDREAAKTTLAMVAAVFGEERQELSDPYIERLLNRDDFWVIAAFIDDDIVGGITAHTLPMTRTESSEVFIYDLAVRQDQQRKGIGRRLITALRRAAADAGIQDVFVPADNDDEHALDFYRAVGGAPSPVTLFVFSADER
jgi:aminoglycoside 3-N-acetyltransferase I